ncbi:MAG: hypothetical protein ACFFDF_00440 [Candidatus Odinarchaeota archaeon]
MKKTMCDNCVHIKVCINKEKKLKNKKDEDKFDFETDLNVRPKITCVDFLALIPRIIYKGEIIPVKRIVEMENPTYTENDTRKEV